MLVKAIFLTFFLVFSLISFIIDLPPGTLVTETLDLIFPYSTLITNNLFNGIFFASIIALVTYIFKRKTRTTPIYTRPSSIDYDLKLLNQDPKTETASNLTKIKGIGPQRAIDLEIAGVKTVLDLAKRSPQHLAEKTGIPIAQISKWIIEANKLKK